MNQRRLALGDQLRLLRESAGISGKRLAEQLGWQPSKVSRIETAKQGVSDSDLLAMGGALGLPADQVEQLRDDLRAIRVEEARWNQQLRVGHSPVQNAVAVAEERAKVIQVFSLTLVPGLAQTANYAWHVFHSLSEMHESPPDTDDAVRARIERQHILYGEGKRIELLMTEDPFLYPIAPAPVILGQIDRLLTLQGLPSVRMGIIPTGSTLPAAVAHSFVIRDDVVTIELLNTEVTTREASDLTLYRGYLDKLWKQAAEGEQARVVLRRLASDLAAST